MTYIIAEIGNNHDGNANRLEHLIEAAADAGADAVKFQIFDPDTLVTRDAPAMVGEGTQIDRLRRLYIPMCDYRDLSGYARQLGLQVVVTFLDVDLLQDGWRIADRLKIASGDITHIELIQAANQTGLPVIVSTGVARDLEIQEALTHLTPGRVTLLHCVSLYPCPIQDASLGRMQWLRDEHCSHVGYSDHCHGIEACVAAAAMGAEVIEKHFTDASRGALDEDYHEPVGDHVHSATPYQMREMVSRIRQVEQMVKSCYTAPLEVRKRMMRGAYAAADIARNTTIGMGDMVALRPCEGRTPWQLRGSRAQRDFTIGEAIR